MERQKKRLIESMSVLSDDVNAVVARIRQRESETKAVVDDVVVESNAVSFRDKIARAKSEIELTFLLLDSVHDVFSKKISIKLGSCNDLETNDRPVVAVVGPKPSTSAINLSPSETSGSDSPIVSPSPFGFCTITDPPTSIEKPDYDDSLPRVFVPFASNVESFDCDPILASMPDLQPIEDLVLGPKKAPEVFHKKTALDSKMNGTNVSKNGEKTIVVERKGFGALCSKVSQPSEKSLLPDWSAQPVATCHLGLGINDLNRCNNLNLEHLSSALFPLINGCDETPLVPVRSVVVVDSDCLSPAFLWITLPSPSGSDETSLDDLIDEMTDYYTTTPESKDYDVHVDDFVAVLSDARTWLRARVTAVNSFEEICLLLLDFGRGEVVNLFRLRLLEPRFLAAPCWSFSCRLRGAGPLPVLPDRHDTEQNSQHVVNYDWSAFNESLKDAFRYVDTTVGQWSASFFRHPGIDETFCQLCFQRGDECHWPGKWLVTRRKAKICTDEELADAICESKRRLCVSHPTVYVKKDSPLATKLDASRTNDEQSFIPIPNLPKIPVAVFAKVSTQPVAGLDSDQVEPMLPHPVTVDEPLPVYSKKLLCHPDDFDFRVPKDGFAFMFSNFENPYHFHVHPIFGNDIHIDYLNNRMFEFYQYLDQTKFCHGFDPQIGDIVVCRFDSDGNFYRAIVLKFDAEAERPFFVHYFDYGNSEWTRLDSMLPLLEDFAHLPPQSIQCRLGDVKPVSGADWSHMGSSALNSLIEWNVWYRATTCEIGLSTDPAASGTLTLVEIMKNQDTISFSDQMVEKGFACKIEFSKPNRKSEEDSTGKSQEGSSLESLPGNSISLPSGAVDRNNNLVVPSNSIGGNPTGNSDDDTLFADLRKSPQTPTEIRLKRGCWYVVEIVCIRSPGYFFAVLPEGLVPLTAQLEGFPGMKPVDLEWSTEGANERLHEQMRQFYDKVEHDERMHYSKAVVGDLIVTKYNESRFQRAQITEILLERGELMLFYVDFGNKQVVPRSQQLYHLDESFRQPFLAISCILANVEPVEEKWSLEAKEWFKSKVKDKRLVAHVRYLSPNNRPMVDLWDTQGDSNTDGAEVFLNECLISLGFGKRNYSLEQNSKTPSFCSSRSTGSGFPCR